MTVYKMPGQPYTVSVTLKNRGSLTSPQFLVSKTLLLAGGEALTRLSETKGFYTLSPGQSMQVTFSGAMGGGFEEGPYFPPENAPLDVRVGVYQYQTNLLLAEAIMLGAFRLKAKNFVNLWLCNPPLVSIWDPFMFLVPVSDTAPNYTPGYMPIGEGATVSTYEAISTIYLAYRLYVDNRREAGVGGLYVCEPVNVVSGQTLYIDHNTGGVSTYPTGPTDVPRATINVSAAGRSWITSMPSTTSGVKVSSWLLHWSEASGTPFQRSDGRNALDLRIPCVNPYMVFLRAYWWTGYTSWDGPFTIEPGVSYDWTPGGPEKRGTLVAR